MILKSYLIEKNILELKKYKASLFYGENLGLKNDFKENIKKKDKEVEIINFFQEEILKNPDVILNEVQNISLFNNKKIIFLNNISDKFYEQINTILDYNKEYEVYLFSEILDKKSKLRNLFEKEKNLATIPCYKDNLKTLEYYVLNALKGYKGLDRRLISLIISNSNLDRDIIKNEIGKIKSCFQDGIIDFDKTQKLLNILSTIDFDNLKNASLAGNKNKLNELISLNNFSSEENILYLRGIYQRLIKLKETKSLSEATGNIELAMEQLKPKIFWKEKEIFALQAKKWDKRNIDDALYEVQATEMLIKSNSQIRSDILIKNLLVNICKRISKSS